MPAPYDARIIANEFIRRNGSPLLQMKLQKLIYISHGWNLAVNGYALIENQIEAWDGGPVIRLIWNHIRDFGYNAPNYLIVDHHTNEPYSENLTDTENGIIDHTWRKYNVFSGLELSEMTHKLGTPWSNAYFGVGRNSLLLNEDIQQHFIELALAGRKQKS